MKKTSWFLLVVLALGGLALSAQTPTANATPKEAAPTMKTFFIRIIPPRPTFDRDATPAEQALMDEHYVYWKDLFDKGVCVFGGPVLDPKGVYGVLAVEAASEDEARRLANADPAVKAGLIHTEVAEMRAVFLHKSN
jgi:uncharacterized protein YciI